MSIAVSDVVGGKTQAPVTLKRAILIYDGAGGSVATVHDVAMNNNHPVIMPGTGLDLGALQKTIMALVGEHGKTDFYLERNVICATFTKLIWWKASCVRPIWFDTKKKGFNRRLSGKDVTHPNLLFYVGEGQLRVFALAKGERPEPKTRLYLAPYYNVSTDGYVCQGTARVPQLVTPVLIPEIEKAFFESAFTHSNSKGDRLVRYKGAGGHDEFWLAMRSPSGRRKKIDPKWLIRNGMTVHQLIHNHE